MAPTFWRRELLIVAGLCLLAALPRLAYAAWAPVFIGGDSQQYYEPVYDLLHGDGFTVSFKRPPGFPVLILASHTLFGPELGPIAAANHLFGVCTVALTYGLGRLTFGRWAGVLAALLIAVEGPMLRLEQTLLSEALFTVFYVLAVFLLVVGLRRRGPWPWIGGGAALGLASLARPAGLPLLALLPPLLLLIEGAWRPSLKHTGLALAGCALVLTPWMLRNWDVYGSFTVAGQGQALVALAMKYPADFDFDAPLVAAVDADPRKAAARKVIQEAIQSTLEDPTERPTPLRIHQRIKRAARMSDAEADSAMGEILLRAHAARPVAFLNAFFREMARLAVGPQTSLRSDWDRWSIRAGNGEDNAALRQPPTPEQESAFERVAALEGIYQPSRFAAPLLALFALGVALALAVPAWRPGLLVAVAVIAVLAAAAATVGAQGRYRTPADPLIHVLAMGGLVGAVGLARNYLSQRRFRRADWRQVAERRPAS